MPGTKYFLFNLFVLQYTILLCVAELLINVQNQVCETKGLPTPQRVRVIGPIVHLPICCIIISFGSCECYIQQMGLSSFYVWYSPSSSCWMALRSPKNIRTGSTSQGVVITKLSQPQTQWRSIMGVGVGCQCMTTPSVNRCRRMRMRRFVHALAACLEGDLCDNIIHVLHQIHTLQQHSTPDGQAWHIDKL